MNNILIVGAGKGIGLETARLLRNENLYTISRNTTPELDELNTQFFELDVAKDDLNEISLPDELHGIVFCPGSINLRPFNRLTEEDFLADFNQNFMGAVRIIQKCLPALKKSKSASIVLFSTVAAKVGMPFHTSIAASKGAIEGFAKSLAASSPIPFPAPTINMLFMFLIFCFLTSLTTYLTASQSFSHFLRQEKGLSQVKHIFVGRCSFFIFFKTF